MDDIQNAFSDVDPNDSETWENWLEERTIVDRSGLQDVIEEVSLYVSAFTNGSGGSHYGIIITSFEEAFVEVYTEANSKHSAYRDGLDDAWSISHNVLDDNLYDEDGVSDYPPCRAVEEALTAQMNAYDEIVYDTSSQ